MNFNNLINKETVNTNNDRGIVTSLDEKYLVVKYPHEEKTYNTELVFKNKYITFVEGDLNKEIENYFLKREQINKEKELELEHNREIVRIRNKKINDRYLVLWSKNRFLKCLFGKDFLYPPYVLFLKKYKRVISKIY